MYSWQMVGKKAKGTKMCVIKHEIKPKDYKI